MLKKYWKLIMFSLIICFATSLYFINLYGPIQRIPTYGINTIFGDGSLIKDVHIRAFVENKKDYSGQSLVNIDQNKNEKEGLLPFYKRFDDGYSDLDYMRRVKDYRSFMRLKSVNDYSSETDKYLAYVDYEHRWNWYNYSTLKLDVLDKETGQSQRISIDLKKELDLKDSSIESIMLVGDLAYITISSYIYDLLAEEEDGYYEHTNEGYDYYLISVDLQAGDIVQTDMLASLHGDDYWEDEYYIISLPDQSKGDRAIIGLMKRTYEENTMESTAETAGLRYVTAKGIIQGKLPLNDGSEEPLLLYDGELILGSLTESGANFKLVDLETGEVILMKTYNGLYLDIGTFEASKDKVIYFSGRKDIDSNDTTIFGLKADTLELIYEGELKTDHKRASEYDIYIYDLQVKQK